MSEPLTEQRHVRGLIVYGYLQPSSPARARALRDALAGYCRQHELDLASVFTEYGDGAWTALLDVLALPGRYGVILPARSHLGTGRVADRREQQLASVGARLLLIRRVCPLRPRPLPLTTLA